MLKKVFITRKIPDVGIAALTVAGVTVDVFPEDRILTQGELIEHLKAGNYDAVLCLLTDKIDAAVFDAAPSVMLYANYATGFDNIDLAEAKKRGIAVTNAPGDMTSEAVAEHSIALALALAARVVEADDFVRNGGYDGWSPMHFIGTDLIGKTLGLVGAGRIGVRVAEYARGLGMRVLYTDVARNARLDEKQIAEYCDTVEMLLPQADVVSLHVPLLDTTKHLMNEARLRMMKPTAFLINTARGPIIDEIALVKILQEKAIGGAALDVFEFEPALTPGLTALGNVILTPHIASASVAARNQMAEIAAANILDHFSGAQPRNIVNA